jgi:putative membrane protein
VFWPWGPGGFGWVEGLVIFLFWVAVIGLAVALLRREMPHMHIERRPPALDLLEERYARGEISRDEFLERRAVLLHLHQPTPAPPPDSAPGVSVPEPPPPPSQASTEPIGGSERQQPPTIELPTTGGAPAAQETSDDEPPANPT